MGATTGVDFIIQVEDPANSGTYITVAGQRGATLNRTLDLADVTSKDSDGWEENLPTIRHWSIDFDGVLVESDEAFAALEDAFNNATQVNVQMMTAAGNKYSGLATLTDFPIEAPYDAEATYSGTLQGSGALVKS